VLQTLKRATRSKTPLLPKKTTSLLPEGHDELQGSSRIGQDNARLNTLAQSWEGEPSGSAGSAGASPWAD
jgi:hypothetical protein